MNALKKPGRLSLFHFSSKLRAPIVHFHVRPVQRLRTAPSVAQTRKSKDLALHVSFQCSFHKSSFTKVVPQVENSNISKTQRNWTSVNIRNRVQGETGHLFLHYALEYRYSLLHVDFPCSDDKASFIRVAQSCALCNISKYRGHPATVPLSAVV
ncbi:hypothetical protein L3X38_038174 [Prunus dulcis]|uniref:Uncharacterized protein n=1 Tax=Prunus dulcis TaxID=3755 RepID=A0AAD4V708_PRUDU|nr:hypothetical protein L3X38_038174 [Prunus dulcis]